MSYSSDSAERVNTVALFDLRVWHSDGQRVHLTVRYRVEISGYPEPWTDDHEIEIDRVHVVAWACGDSEPGKRNAASGHVTSLIAAQLELMYANEDGRWDGEQEDVHAAFKAALNESAYEATGARNPFSRNFEG